jgi:hypothetical protein
MINDKDIQLLASAGQSDTSIQCSTFYSPSFEQCQRRSLSHSIRSIVIQNATSSFLGTNSEQSNSSLLLKSTFRYMLRVFKPPLRCTQLCNAVRTDSSIIVASATLTLLPSLIPSNDRSLPERVLQRVRSSASSLNLPISSRFRKVIQ